MTCTSYVLNIRKFSTDKLTQFGLSRVIMQRVAPRFISANMGVAVALCMLMLLPSGVSAELVATDYSTDVKPVDFYSANGSSVNSAHTDWGQAGTLLGRVAEASHDPQANWMGLSDLPNPREISNIVCAQPGIINDERELSDFNWLWGQFITHEIDFTLTQNGRVGENGTPEAADIDIDEDDPVMGAPGGSKMRFFRSLYVNVTEDEVVHREHPNSITSWIDGSVVYGSSESTMNWLRTF